MASSPLPNLSPNPQFHRFNLSNSHQTPQAHLPNRHLLPPNHLFPSKSYFHSIISRLSKRGQIRDALNLLEEMLLRSLPVGPEIYGDLLQGCVYERDLCTGQQIHARIIKKGDFFARNEYIETKLLVLYAKCDALGTANCLFGRLRVKNMYSWAAMIGLYSRMGFNEEALMGICEMVSGGYLADNFVVPNVLKACGALRRIGFGRGVHGYVVKMGFDECVFVLSSLVDMYGKCRVLGDARKVFDDMLERNVVTWNSMIAGYVQNGFNEEAIGLFFEMRLDNVVPSQVTLSSFLSSSANLGAVEEGKQGHAIIVLRGFEFDNFLGSSVVNFYSKVGLIEYAESVFSRMLERDVVTWNLLISSFVQCEQFDKALHTCHLMKLENVGFDSVTLSSILSLCARTRNMKLGKEGHGYCIRNNLVSDLVVASRIVDMYVKCDRIDCARHVFDSTTNRSVLFWNTLLTAYGELGLVGEALKLFYHMQLESFPPNVVSWNVVIWGYLRTGLVNEAKEMFSQMQFAGVHPNLVTFEILTSGLVQNGLGNEAIGMFRKMQEFGIRPNGESIISVLSACTAVASLQYGRAIHGYILRCNLLSPIPITTALVDMYAKCGNIGQATKVSYLISNDGSHIFSANDLHMIKV